MYLEPLEPRTLLSSDPTLSLQVITPASTLISNPSPRDVVFDPTRNQLLVTAPSQGGIARYDASTGQLLDIIPLPAPLAAGAITPDGKFLYVASNITLTVYKIDLSTELYSTISLGTSPLSSIPDLAISNGRVIVSQNSPDGEHLHSIEIQTDAVSDLLFNDAPLTTRDFLILASSADYKHTFMAGRNHDNEAGGGGRDSLAYDSVYNLAVSRDGALHAISSNKGIFIINSTFTEVANASFTNAALAFDPVGDFLYVADPVADMVRAYDTNTWANLYNIPIGEDLPQVSFLGPGNMALSDDGSSLFLITGSGVRTFQLKPIYGSSILLTAQIASSQAGSLAPTGSITFTDSLTNTILGRAPIAAGFAQLTLSTLHAGAHSIIASYDGDNSYNPAVSSAFQLTIRRAPTTAKIDLTQEPDGAVVTISSLHATPDAGQVDLFEGATNIGTAPVHGGLAQLATPTTGTHSLRLGYSGSDDFLPTDLSFNFHARFDTKLQLAADANVSWSQQIYITATATVPSSGFFPSGKVDFYDGSTFLSDAQLSSGQATIRAAFAPGPHSITAQYRGNANFRPSAAAAVQILAGPANSSIVLSSSATYFPKSTNVTLTANITANNAAIPDGSIEFFDGNRSLGLATIANGTASLTRSFAAGAHSISARYAGNASFNASTSNAVQITAFTPTTIDLLVLFTKAAMVSSGSGTSMRNDINAAVAGVNLAFINSRIPVVIRLVHSQQIKYTESGKFHTDLRRLQRPHDGFMDDAPRLRNTYRADLVSLFESDGDLGGVAYELRDTDDSTNASFAYSVVLASQAAGPTFSLAHELGHNLGATHDIEHREGAGATKFSNGYRFRGNDGVLYHDIMSYDPGQTIPYFSNPQIKYKATPIGTATANASRTITLMAPYVAKYR